MSDTERSAIVDMPARASQQSGTSWPRWRVAIIRGWAALLTLYALMMAQGVVTIGSAGPHEQFMYATSTIWKLLSLGAVIVVMWSGGRSVAAYWALAVGQLAWVIAGVLVPQPDSNGVPLTMINLAILYGPLIAFRPQRSDLLRPNFRPHRLLLTIAVFGSLPLLVFAARLSGHLTGELGFDMVGLYAVLAGLSILAAFAPGGRVWLAAIVGLGVALTGIVGIAFPHDLGSPGLISGLSMLAIGLGFSALGVGPSLRSRH